ncbi:ABC transporter permease subunit [Labrys monachus]|uniref:Dipeptide transport system permease protein n=1 Tax=Labrys monachus TaxID=217067 RepID=A0ABU0FMA9_9HYPH|nr:ABC transporter permease subunit [Labrys monachus]MDQ0395646.1 dipeptide transport system permease protein [Labrys monachus]
MAADTGTAAEAGPAPSAAPPTLLAETWDGLKQNRGAVGGLVVLVLIVLTAVFADFLAPHSPIAGNDGHELLPPAWIAGGDWRFPLGTDASNGRDMLSRILYGARYSLGIGLSVMLVSVLLGVVLGLVAAFRGGIVDIVLMRTMDLIMSIPDLVLAMVIVAILQPSLTNTIVAVTVVFLPRYVRIVRATALAELSKDYVTAARVVGVGTLRLMFVTVLPNCLAPLIVQATLGVSDAILEAAALGFLGMGAQPPSPEWGAMLADARQQLQSAPWIATMPGLAILVTVVAINLFGDGLRDALDPKLKRG